MSGIEFIENERSPARIRVVGVGGCGGNIIQYLQARNVAGMDYAAVNTDSQALSRIENAACVHIGGEQMRGLGAGADPELAARAAEEESSRLQDIVCDCDMVFVACGMGKGTGTGASPLIAKLARDAGVLTVAVATLPFRHERRDKIAEKGMQALAAEVDSLLVVPNAKLMKVLGDDVLQKEALAAANGVLYNAVCGISEIITKSGEMNLDFNDVRAVMSAKGRAVMGSACKSGPARAAEAAHEALCCPLMEDVDLSAASHFLVNITASSGSMKLSEADAVHEVIDDKAPHCESERFVGQVYDDSMGDEMRVTIIATGIAGERPAVGDGGDMKLIEGAVQDPCFVSGRTRKQREDLLRKYDGNEARVPTILRRQKN